MLALVMLALSVAGAVICIAQLRSLSATDEIAKLNIKEMNAKIAELNGKGDKVQQQLTPEQRALLVGAHKLVANKTFAWSRLFADLENVLPGSVSASRIAVENVYKEGDRTKAELEFGVLSRDYPAVMTMIDNMNSSGIFQAELRGQDLQKNEHSSYTEYTLRLIYTPAAGYSPELPKSDVVQYSPGGNQ